MTASAPNMLELVAQLPDQIESTRASVDVEGLSARDVVFCGMGGSAAAAELARGVLRDAPVRVSVNRHYRLPARVADAPLFVFSSYSGNTEETLSAYDEVAARFPHAPRIVFTSGGNLQARAEADGVARVRYPKGLPPRAALGHAVGATFEVLDRIAPELDLGSSLDEAIIRLREGNAEYVSDSPDNAARSLARRLYGRLPLLYASPGLTEAAAWRCKAQINENAKAHAFVSLLPELDHNEIVGWEVETAFRSQLFVLAFRDRHDHPRVQRRFEATRDALGDRAADWETVESRGESALARLMSLVQFGDYLSVYLAREYGVDPMPVQLIDDLKGRLQD